MAGIGLALQPFIYHDLYLVIVNFLTFPSSRKSSQARELQIMLYIQDIELGQAWMNPKV